jgi:major outer membrane protein
MFFLCLRRIFFCSKSILRALTHKEAIRMLVLNQCAFWIDKEFERSLMRINKRHLNLMLFNLELIMKKLALFALTLFSCGAVYALPLGNPADASLYRDGIWWCGSACDPCNPCISWCDALSLRLGFWGDYVFNRNLEIDGNGDNPGDIQTTRIMRNEGLIILNYCNWIDIFGTIGASNYSISTPDSSLLTAVGNDGDVLGELVFDPVTSYSAGIRATLWECDCFLFGIEAQWAGAQPRMGYYMNLGDGVVTYISPETLDYNEWQVGFGGSYRFDNGYGTAFIPYVGVKVSGVKWAMDNFQYTAEGTSYTLRNLKNKKTWGYAIGVTATVNETVGIGVEGRYGDEKALYANAELRF